VPEDSAWLRLSRKPNVVITPHIAFYTQADMQSMARLGIERLL
jgi:lactate dehydrogenase-like 2-hydroxyacid dehydrogenase